jgi:hypothetical protein
MARGEIMGWLNTDDMYLPCTLSRVAAAIGTTSKPNLVYGGCLHFYQGTTHTYGFLPPDFDAEQLTYHDYLAQPSTFWTKALWDQTGALNESYHYVLDWEWFLRASQLADLSQLKIISQFTECTLGIKAAPEKAKDKRKLCISLKGMQGKTGKKRIEPSIVSFPLSEETYTV